MKAGQTLTMLLILTLCAAATASEHTIDLTESWRFQPDPEDVGVAQNWHATGFDDSSWPLIKAGTRWEEQGFPDVDGTAWMRRNASVPEDWKDGPVWLVLGGLSDSGKLYCNGQRVAVWGDPNNVTVHHTPLIADLSPALRSDRENVLVIRIFDWGGSGGIWNSPCELTREPKNEPLNRLFNYGVDYTTENIVVDTDMSVVGSLRPPLRLHAALYSGADAKPFRSVEIPVEKMVQRLELETPKPFPDRGVRMEVSLRDRSGNLWGGFQVDEVIPAPTPPAWPAPYAGLRMRNNFVTELAEIPLDSEEEQDTVFQNPRDGWIFFCVRRQDEIETTPHLFVDAEEEPVVWRRNPETGAPEAMRWMREGERPVRAKPYGPQATLEIRAIPELSFCYYPFTWNTAVYGDSDWSYVERHALSHVNTIVTRGNVPEEEFDQWLAEGRRWIANSGLPGLKANPAPAADEVFHIWAQNRGVTQPGFSGLIVDEFLLASAAHYAAWGEAAARLDGAPSFADRTFYAWCGEIHRQRYGLEFARGLMNRGHRFVWELYLPERPTLENAETFLRRQLSGAFREWKAALPGVENHMVLCLGYLSSPPESLNVYPHIDYRVFLDMQFHLLANDSEFARVYGLMEYMSNYADEEALRFAHRLFRHYCIEGRRERYTDAPLVLTHLENPDFAEQLKGWQTEAAAPGGIGAATMTDLSWLQGRYPKTSAGDTFCRMTRSQQGPNRFRQTIRDLKPGELYSVKLFSADMGNLHAEEKHAVRVEIGGAEILAPHSFQYPYHASYSHKSGPYTTENPAWFNYHRIVFRPEGDTAPLCISDWISDTEPGGPEGQGIGINFVEVQPFHEP